MRLHQNYYFQLIISCNTIFYRKKWIISFCTICRSLLCTNHTRTQFQEQSCINFEVSHPSLGSTSVGTTSAFSSTKRKNTYVFKNIPRTKYECKFVLLQVPLNEFYLLVFWCNFSSSSSFWGLLIQLR
jgi:hypothetical protein